MSCLNLSRLGPKNRLLSTFGLSCEPVSSEFDALSQVHMTKHMIRHMARHMARIWKEDQFVDRSEEERIIGCRNVAMM